MNNLTYRLKSAFIIVMIVSVFFPLMIVLDVDEPHWQAGSIGTLLISFIAAFRLGYIALKGEVVPLLMTFWIFVAFWMGLAGFAQTLKNDFFWWGQYSSVDQFMAVLVVFLALLAYEFGRWFSSKTNFNISPFQVLITRRRAYILTIVSVLLALVAIAGLGGLSGVFITRNDANHDVIIGVVDKSKYLMLNTALRVPSFLALLSVWYIWVKRDEYLLTLADRHKHLLILLFLFLMNMVTNFPLALARYWLGAMIIALVFCGLKKTNKTMSQWIVGFVVVLLVFFPITSEFRHMESITDVEKIELSGVVKHLYHGDYDAFQQVMNTVQTVEYNGLSYGSNFLVAPLFWVPRSLWTSKPYGTGQEVAESFRYDFTNLSEPLWAEAYYAFGYLGVAIILFLYGFLSSRLDTLYQLESTGSLINIFVPFWCGFQLFFLRGDLLNGAAYSLPLIVIMVAVYRKKRV